MPNGLPLPGRPIPYAFTAAEIQDFLNTYSTDPVVGNYLFSKQPAYGVIFAPPNAYGQLLLWFDAAGVFHVIDVTNLSIVSAVEQPAYQSPDSSVIDNIVQQVETFVAGLPSASQALSAVELLAVVAGLYFLYKIL